MNQYLTIVDFIIPPFLLVFIFFISKFIQQARIEQNSSYKYYVRGVMAKVIGGISVCLIYIFYYGGGDTLNFYSDNNVIVNMFLTNTMGCFKILSEGPATNWHLFNSETGWPIYVTDPKTFMVIQLTWPLTLLSFKSYIGTTILLAWISYIPIWRMYQTFLQEFPSLEKEFAIAILFMPSVIFWGSGLLKDTITLSAVALFTSSFYMAVVKRKRILKNLILIFLAAYILAVIKAYILFALLPGSILWLSGIFLSSVDNELLKKYLAPILVTIALASGYTAISFIGGSLGEYSLDNVLTKAVTTQQDLKSEYYQGSSFDIGDYDPTVAGILSKAPVAINAALFRPYLWEANNPAMFVSGIENAVLLFFSIYLLFKLRVYNLFNLIFKHRMLFFTVTFSLFFSFSVGLTTSNFGSLVRYKIPAIPFFVASLYIIRYTYLEWLKEREKIREEIRAESSSFRRAAIAKP